MYNLESCLIWSIEYRCRKYFSVKFEKCVIECKGNNLKIKEEETKKRSNR
jgi:hypothetical protein